MNFDYSSFGLQLQNALRFAKSNFDGNLTFNDAVQSCKVSGGDLFKKVKGDRWLMRADSIPGFIALKAIGVDSVFIYVETAQVDIDRAWRIIEKNLIPITLLGEGEKIVDKASQNTLAVISGRKEWQCKPSGTERRLWTIDFPSLGEEEIGRIFLFLDLLAQEEAFLEGEAVAAEYAGSVVPVGGLRQTLTLNQSLMQLLRQEQVPLIMFEQRLVMQTTVRTEQVQALYALQGQIDKMKGQELVDFLEADLSEEGRRKTLSIFLFVIAGRVKRAKQELSWKKARTVARRLVNRPLEVLGNSLRSRRVNSVTALGMDYRALFFLQKMENWRRASSPFVSG